MKKIIILLVLTIFLFGCKTPDDKLSDYEILQKVADTITLPEETSSNLELKTEYEFNQHIIQATWESDNEEIISSSGLLNQTYEEEYVTLLVTLKLNDAQLAKYFDMTVLPLDKESSANEILDLLEIPSEISDSITLNNLIKYGDTNYKVSWKSNNENIINNRGIIHYSSIEQTATLTASINFEGDVFKKEFNITIKPYDTTEMMQYLNELNIPSEITESISLPSNTTINNKKYSISWTSNDTSILDNDGQLGFTLVDKQIVLKATISIDDVVVTKDYNLTIPKTSEENLIKIIQSRITIPNVISNDIFLQTDLGNNIKGSWESSDESIISSKGKIDNTISGVKSATLTFKINIGEITMTLNYDVKIQPLEHFLMNNLFNGQKENLEVDNEGKLVLSSGKTQGTYYSEEIDCHTFSEAVATWCATSSTTSTCELFVSLRVNGQFSEYITYGEWGLGLKNGSIDQTKDLIRLIDDEIKVLNNKYADGLKFKLVLKRKSASDESPKVSLVTFALNLTNYTYNFDKSLVKSSVKYDVPRLYQHDVPGIGGIICSVTSSTMMLKFKGYDFSNKNPLEHEYMAALLYDYSNKMYGNWVFNCVGMSAFGERAYVKRFFNTYEFLYSIQEFGPMAASIKGTVKYFNLEKNANGSYTSAGHLLVVTGYEITPSETYIYINDPNVNGVSIRMTLPDFLNIWRNVSYILE